MNYISKLQEENAKLKAQLNKLDENLDCFIGFLHSPKFQGQENGERKDWIATTDVVNTIRAIQRENLD